MNIEVSLDEAEKMLSAYVQAKFYSNPRDFEPYFGSAVVAGVYRRLLADIIGECGRTGDVRSVAQYRSWSEWRSRSWEQEVVVNFVAGLHNWDRWNDDEKGEVLRSFCSPFTPSEEELADLRQRGDRARRAG